MGSTSMETFFWMNSANPSMKAMCNVDTEVKIFLHEKMSVIIIISFSCMSFVSCILCTYQNRLTENVDRKPLVGNIKKRIPDGIIWKLQIVKLVIIQFSPFFSYLFHISSTFSPRHIVLQYLQIDQFLIHAGIPKNTFNPLNPELNPICCLLALLGANHFLHVNRVRFKSLTLRELMSYIYICVYIYIYIYIYIWSTHS